MFNIDPDELESISQGRLVFTSQQKRWLQYLYFNQDRSLFAVEQVKLESFKLYTVLAVELDKYVKSKTKKTFMKTAESLWTSSFTRDDVLFSLFAIAEAVICFHYFKKGSIQSLRGQSGSAGDLRRLTTTSKRQIKEIVDWPSTRNFTNQSRNFRLFTEH